VIDSHVHLHRHEFDDDRSEVLDRAFAAGLSALLNVGYDLPSSEASIMLAESDPRIYATVGVHPHDATQLADEAGNLTAAGRQTLARLRELAAHPRVLAIGEIGLDYFRDLSPRPAQRRALLVQLELAEQVGLPVIFHIRDAYPETRAVIEESGIPGQGAVLHAFAGDVATARWARRHRLLLGIGGPLTYKNSRLPAVLNEAAVTADDLLLETDAPWLPPVPYRGKRNESAYLGLVLTQLATVLGMDADEVSAGTDAAFSRLFGERYAVCNEDRNGSPARGNS